MRTCTSLQKRYSYHIGLFIIVIILFWLLQNHCVLEETEVNVGPTDRSPHVEFLRSVTPYLDEHGKPVADADEVLYFDSSVEDEKRLPNALIIGVRKAGTRALINSLAMHPTIKACPKEVHFFDIQENYDKGLKWYREQMPLSHLGQITIEKTPAYFVTEGVPSRVHRMSKSIKLLVVVRDPTTRAISDYAQLSDHSQGKLRPFEERVTQDPAYQYLDTNSTFVSVGVYVQHLEKWLTFFSMNQLHFVNGEELVKNPVYELRMVEKFLGIKPYFNEKFFYFNETKGFPCFVSNNPKKKGNSTTVECLSESKGRPHPTVKEEVLNLLQDYYRPFNKELYNMVGRDFGWD